MKKGVSLSINFVIMAVLAVSVILIVSVLFTRGYLSGSQSLSRTEIRTRCMDLCLIDSYARRTNIGGSCYTNPPSGFSEKEYLIDGEYLHCYDIVDCTVDTNYGVCRFDEFSGDEIGKVCTEVSDDDKERLKEIGLCV